MRERADGVESRLRHLSDHEDLDRAYLPHRYIDLKAGDLRAAMLDQPLGLAERKPRHLNRSDLGHQDRSVALDLQRESLVYAAPEQHVDRVAGAENIIVTDWRVLSRRKGRHLGREELVGELREL